MDICGRTSLLPGSCVCPSHLAVIGVSPALTATDNTSLRADKQKLSGVDDSPSDPHVLRSKERNAGGDLNALWMIFLFLTACKAEVHWIRSLQVLLISCVSDTWC